MKTKTLRRLAGLTRRYDRYDSPIRYRLTRSLLKLVYGERSPESSHQLVVPYDEGLFLVNTRFNFDCHILFKGYFEPGVASFIKKAVRPGDTCLDIGANSGCHTLVMAHAAGREGRVVALEPQPSVAGHLRRNVRLNRLDNVTVVEAALTAQAGEVEFYAPSANARNSGIAGLRPARNTTERIRTKGLSGRTLVADYHIQSCDLMKIDVEGAEMICLLALADLIEQHRPVLIVEYRKELWDKFGYSIQSAMEMFRSLEYDMYFEKHDLIRPLDGAPAWACNLIAMA